MQKKEIIIFLFIFLWLVFIGQGGVSPFFGDINFIDEGQFSAWANRVSNGEIIYKDFYVQYGPLMIYPIYALMSIFGKSFFIIRIWSVLNVFLGIVIFYFVQRKFNVNKYFIYISLLSLILYPGIHFRQWVGIIFLYYFVVSIKTKRVFGILFSSFLINIILFQSFEIFIFSFICALIFIFYNLILEKDLSLFIKNFFIWIIFSTLNFIALYSALHQKEFVDGYFETALEFAGSIAGINLPNGKGLPEVNLYADLLLSPTLLIKSLFSKNLLFYWSIVILFTSLVFEIARTLFIKSLNKNIFPLIFIFYVIFLYINIIGRSGHYNVVFPFIIFILSYHFTIVLNFYSKNRHYVFFKRLLVAVFILYALRHVVIYRNNIFPEINKYNHDLYVNRVWPTRVSYSQSLEIIEMQKYFSENNSIKPYAFVPENAPALYFLLDINNPTKYDLPLLAGSLSKRLEIIESLEKKKPNYILRYKNAWQVDDIPDIVRNPEVYEYISKNYKYQKVLGSYEIMRLK